MMYYLYALFTAPGVIIHELGHAFFCFLAGVKIHKMRLFRFGNPAGYVTHDEPTKFYQAVLVSFGPLIANTLLALLAFARVFTPYLAWQNIVPFWLGAVISLHAIPSTGDAKALLATTNRRVWRNPLIIIGYPFVLVIYMLNILKRLHIPIVYATLLFWLGNIFLKG